MADIESLRNKVNFVKLAIPQKPLIPSFGYILLTPTELRANDGECYLQTNIEDVGIEFNEEQEYAVEAKSFDLIKKAAKNADAYVEDGMLKVAYGRSNLEIPLHDPDQAFQARSVNYPAGMPTSITLSDTQIASIQKATRGCRVPKHKAFSNILALDFDHHVVFVTNASLGIVAHIDDEKVIDYDDFVALPWRLPGLLKAANSLTSDQVKLDSYNNTVRFSAGDVEGLVKLPSTGAPPSQLLEQLKIDQVRYSTIPEGLIDFVDQAAAAEKNETYLEVECEGKTLNLQVCKASANLSASFDMEERYVNFLNETSAKRLKEAMKGMSYMGAVQITSSRSALVFANENHSRITVTV